MDQPTAVNLAEVIAKQNRIIEIQAEAIGDLFSLLMQHITVEEADQLPTVKKINLAVEIRSTIEGMTEQE
jgi:hypothetical protein